MAIIKTLKTTTNDIEQSVYPKTVLEAVVDAETNETLDVILDNLNEKIDNIEPGGGGEIPTDVQEQIDSKVSKSGDTMTGALKISNGSFPALVLKHTGEDGGTTAGMQFENSNGVLGGIGMPNKGNELRRWNKDLTTSYEILDSGNYSNYALPLTGGTVTGEVNIKNNINVLLSRDNTGDTLVPIPTAGTLQKSGDYMTSETGLKTMKSFIGSYYGGTTSATNAWNSVISVRHRNGASDGVSHGMYLRSLMNRSNADLIWNNQNAGTWESERTILDSRNYSSYALPLSGGTMTGNIKFNNDKGIQDANGNAILARSASTVNLASIAGKYPIYVGGHPSINTDVTYLRGYNLYFHSDQQFIISNRSIAVHSDKRVKTNESLLVDEIEKYNQFFNNLQPRKYNYIRDEEGEAKSTGFFAQEVHQALLDAGLSLNDFGGLYTKEAFIEGQAEGDDEAVWYEDFYSLAYTEFIPIIVAKIQYLEKMYSTKLEEIQNDYNSKLQSLEEKINKLEEVKA